jgi:outer membrane protein TolC
VAQDTTAGRTRRRREIRGVRDRFAAAVALALPLLAPPAGLAAQQAGGSQAIELTVERMVELGLRDSYRVRQLVLGIERTRSLLRGQQAGLKSRVEMELATPEFESISDYKWNSTLQKNELIHEDTRRWEAELSIRQPVILFGFPTNGFLSLNNRMYRYRQLGETNDIEYYNRYFIGYQQPLFQPNRMRNDLEEAELNLERSELDYRNSVVEMVDDLEDDFYALLESAHQRAIAEQFVGQLQEAAAAAADVVAAIPARAIEVDQLRVELANAREQVQQSVSSFRLQGANIKQRLRLSPGDSIVVTPDLTVPRVDVDVERAIELATTMTPRLRRIAVQLREEEIRLDETKGNNSFRMNVGLTYGREMQNPQFDNLWQEPRNSYTVDLTATIPIWDWGQRRYRIEADQYQIQRTRLQAEEARSQIETSVRNEVRNLEEYEQRAVNMEENLTLAQQITRSTLERYRLGEVTLVELIQTIDRQTSTAENFLDAYLGYRQALRRLQVLTHYDFEHGLPLLERFTVGPPTTQGS